MGRKELPRTLTLERFAAGKDGRTNAFKKKKQGAKVELGIIVRTEVIVRNTEGISALCRRSFHAESSPYGTPCLCFRDRWGTDVIVRVFR